MCSNFVEKPRSDDSCGDRASVVDASEAMFPYKSEMKKHASTRKTNRGDALLKRTVKLTSESRSQSRKSLCSENVSFAFTTCK